MARYLRTFSVFDKSARIDLTQGYQEVEWEGLLQGAPAKTARHGATDTFVRFSVNLLGAPPLQGKPFADYRVANDSDTIIGVGVVIRLPTGDYHDQKLLNLGENRYVVRPQIGVSHQLGQWITEVTAEASIYTENDEFFKGNTLEQEPLYIVHAHAMYTFRPGLWVGVSAGYDYGGKTSVNGNDSDNNQQEIGWGLRAAYPLSRTLGVSMTYISTRTEESTGVDADTVLANMTYMW